MKQPNQLQSNQHKAFCIRQVNGKKKRRGYEKQDRAIKKPAEGSLHPPAGSNYRSAKTRKHEIST